MKNNYFCYLKVHIIALTSVAICSFLTFCVNHPKQKDSSTYFPIEKYFPIENSDSVPMAAQAEQVVDNTSFPDESSSIKEEITPLVPVPEAVDLGLSVKWGSHNVGASHPEDYGDYYAWGEIDKKYEYSWKTYKWCDGAFNKLTKYNSDYRYGYTDYYTKGLELSDDVAHVKLGGKWRMPTDTEISELLKQCKWTWTSINNVNGYLLTSKSNGNSIFLPAGGIKENASTNDKKISGYYWSSSQVVGFPYEAFCLYILSPKYTHKGVNATSGHPTWSTLNRYLGSTIRPVFTE
ncbi:MAG: hypothetical protein IK041_04245 [Bacteroidales bacterium]|nr:hypothetical protein [Bacteroidales bacterium]